MACATGDIRENIRSYFEIVPDKFTEHHTDKEILLLVCLRFLDMNRMEQIIPETFLDSIHVEGWTTIRDISISSSCVVFKYIKASVILTVRQQEVRL